MESKGWPDWWDWWDWWDWELEISPHLLKRMVDRRFTEVDRHRMLEHAGDKLK